MWSDNETAIDLLGYRHLVAGVSSIVRDDSLSPATVGIFGDWGGGKSSLLRMVEEDLTGEKGTLVISFNGWLFEGYEDAKSALMGVILDEIQDQRSPTGKTVELLKKLLGRVNWFRVAGSAGKHAAAFAMLGPAGLGLTAAADLAGYSSQIKEKLADTAKKTTADDVAPFLLEEAGQEARKAVREFRQDFSQLLKECGVTRLVVLIDDLDRCLPPVVIEILEAIKLFLFVRNTAFVIGADERLVRYAVRRRFPELPGDVTQVAEEYLEKLIQYPVRIPPLDGSEMETYINLLFAEKAGLNEAQSKEVRERVVNGPPGSLTEVRFNAGIAQQVLESVPPGLKTQLAMSQRIASVLSAGLKGNPRQCKRFLNTLVLRVAMAKSRSLDLDQRVLAKLMLLEYLHSEWFRQLSNLQAVAEGLPPEMRVLERFAAGEEQENTKKPKRKAASTRSSGKATVAKAELAASPQPVPELPNDLKTWLTDNWMKDWLASEPRLAGKDLRPYFYFSRDRLGPMAGAASRMTPTAQDVLRKLLHQSEAQRMVGLKRAEPLSPADASAVFDAIVERVEQEEDFNAGESALPPLVDFCSKRSELAPQLLTFLGRLPTEQLSVGLPMRVVGAINDSPAAGQGRTLLSEWSIQTANSGLAQAAKNALERLK